MDPLIESVVDDLLQEAVGEKRRQFMIRELAKCPRIAVFTGDALYADRPTARAVVKAGKDYVFKLKGATSPDCTTT